jgi:hypothetical protein
MVEQVRILRVLVASPSDVQPERDVVPEVLEALNRSICPERRILLQAIRWETDAYPGFDQFGPQGLIDPILRIEDSDILIGILWKRFGSPSPAGASGTEYEIRRAYESWKTNRRPQIMIYFNQRNYKPKTKADVDQLRRVFEFRDQLPKQGLWWEYNGKAQFKDLLRSHLTNYILRRYSLAQERDSALPAAARTDYFVVQDRLIAEYDRTFVGRADVESEFDTFLRTQPRGYFILRGGPGQGKTAISCHLIRSRGYVHHLVGRTGGRSDSRLILRSLLAQVRPQASGLPESLSELTKIFEEALLGVASRRQPLVIVIDAIDELTPLAGEPPYLITDALPDGAFYFVTCRPGDPLDRLAEALFTTPHCFHDLGPLGLADMRSVLQSRKPDITVAEVERIAEASQGNPLYLRAVADQISASPAYSLHELPATVEGFFRSSTGFLRDENPVLRSVLGLLSAARTPLAVRELGAITGLSQRDIDEQGIRLIRPFLLEMNGCYTLYHVKFHEFVTGSLLYEDELRKSHHAIALWLQRPESASNPYRWASLAHLFESGQRAGLLSAIDSAFLAEKVRRLGYAVLEDIELCTRTLLETGDPSVVERCVSMVESLRVIVGGDIISASARAVQPYSAGADAFRGKLIEPAVPSPAGLDIYVGILPKAEIPADFFEIVPRDGRVAVAIGDAPSIGLKSAFVARFVANLFHRYAETSDSLNLADLLTRLNSAIADHEYFRRVSMQCVELDPACGILHIATAGHPYPVHYSSRRGRCDVLPINGDLLHDYVPRSGGQQEWEQYGLEIAPGDIIVLISDGLTESHLLEGDPYGYRFTEIVESRCKEGSQAIGQAILDHWKAHLRKEDSADDVSVVLLKVTAKESSK